MVKAYQNGILYDGKYYVAPASISLANAADNSTTINDANGYVANVTLTGRTLYKDGAWNTICLPFDVTIAGSPLAGATARPLTSASIEGTTLTLTFQGRRLRPGKRGYTRHQEPRLQRRDYRRDRPQL